MPFICALHSHTQPKDTLTARTHGLTYNSTHNRQAKPHEVDATYDQWGWQHYISPPKGRTTCSPVRYSNSLHFQSTHGWHLIVNPMGVYFLKLEWHPHGWHTLLVYSAAFFVNLIDGTYRVPHEVFTFWNLLVTPMG